MAEELRRVVEQLLHSLRVEQVQTRQYIERVEKAVHQSAEKLVERRSVVRTPVLEDYALRDTLTHETDLAEIGDYDVASIFVRNELDQPVRVTPYGNMHETKMNAVALAGESTVEAGKSEAVNLSVYTGAWLPFSHCTFKADAAPTKGALHITYLLRRV